MLDWQQTKQFQGSEKSLNIGISSCPARGEAKGEAKAVLAILEARGVAFTEPQRQQIFECTDLERLNGWVRRAVTLKDVSELFEQ